MPVFGSLGRLAEIGKGTRFKPGQKSANPNGRPRTAKFSEAVRQIAQEINPATGETNAETLARHTFKRAIAGSVRHQELLLNYGEGKPMQGIELSGPGGSAIRVEDMTEAELSARWLALWSPHVPQGASVPTLDEAVAAMHALAAPQSAPAIDNSTVAERVAERVEIIPAATPAAMTVAKAQTPVPTAPQAKPLSDATRDQAYFLYSTCAVVTGASNSTEHLKTSGEGC